MTVLPLIDELDPQDRASAWKPVVLTVPGAAQKSRWQESIHEVLQPHFKCRGYTYRDYASILRRPGVVIDIWWGLASIVLLVGSFWVDWPHYLGTGTLSVAAAAAGLQQARSRRTACAQVLGTWIIKNGEGAPHVISDSFGSYLVGTAISDEGAEVTLRNAVMSSAPLPRQFPWLRIVKDAKATNVRSEIMRTDRITGLFHLLPLFADDMGDAGNHGFHHCAVVHTGNPDGSCPECRQQRIIAPVHNVRLESGRGWQFRSRAYVQNFWLPFLWNIPIHEFQSILADSRLVIGLLRAEKYDDAEAVVDATLRKEFEWTNGPLEQWIRSTISGYVGYGGLKLSVDDVFDYVSDRLLLNIAMAEEESFKEHGQNERLIQLLNPYMALARLVETAVRLQRTGR